MTAVLHHQLVGVDALGRLCSCGVHGDWLEHLADVSLFLLGASKPAPAEVWVPCILGGCSRKGFYRGLCHKHYRDDVALRRVPDAVWSAEQQRLHNLASFRRFECDMAEAA